MKNMFSKKNKKVPNNLFECYQSDSMTINLWTWAERLETIGIVLAVIVGIAAFITFIAIAIGEYEYSLILIGIIAAPIAAFFEYISFHILALLIGSLASIVQHTKITANIALYNATKNMPSQNSTNATPVCVGENNISKTNANTFDKKVIQNENHKIKTETTNDTVSPKETATLNMCCPSCKEDLSFMEYSESDFLEPQNCPFCDAKIIGIKNGNLYM